jgi:hypothetical protein
MCCKDSCCKDGCASTVARVYWKCTNGARVHSWSLKAPHATGETYAIPASLINAVSFSWCCPCTPSPSIAVRSTCPSSSVRHPAISCSVAAWQRGSVAAWQRSVCQCTRAVAWQLGCASCKCAFVQRAAMQWCNRVRLCVCAECRSEDVQLCSRECCGVTALLYRHSASSGT